MRDLTNRLRWIETYGAYAATTLWLALVCTVSPALAQPCTPPVSHHAGELDPCFVPAGSGFTRSGGYGYVSSIIPQPDGKVLVGGSFDSIGGAIRKGIARLNADGTLDASFDPASGFNGSIGVLALQPDGKMLIGGEFTRFSGTMRNGLARLNADGTLDTSFNLGAGFAWSRGRSGVGRLFLQPGGKILVNGNFDSFNGISCNNLARLHANGALDTSFNPGHDFNPYGMAMQPDGKLLVSGWFYAFTDTNRALGRFNADGTPDASFNCPGFAFLLPCNGMFCSGNVSLITVQPDGKVLIGGSFGVVNGNSRWGIARLNMNGTLDSSFAPSMGFLDFYGSKISSLAVQPDGKVLAGARFTSRNGGPPVNIFRFNTDGTLDASFNPGTGFNSSVTNLVVQPDGKVLVGGSFTSYNGTTRGNLARIYTDSPTPTHHALTASARAFAAPNPASQSFILHGLTAPAALTLHDALGRRVLHTQAHPNQPIPVQGLPPGLYRWHTDTGQAGSVVVQ